MTEKDFLRDLAAGLQAQGYYVRKWPDLARGVTKPFDLCAAYQGQFRPIEGKLKQFDRQGPLVPTDWVLDAASFKGREHQVPGLLELWQQGQALPMIAVAAAVLQRGRVREQRAWLLPIRLFAEQRHWRICELPPQHEMIRIPGLGWQEKDVSGDVRR